MSKLTYAEVESEVNDVIKEEPFNREDNVESTGNTDSNWEIKLEVEDYNLEDLHHVVDIKDELPFGTHNEETNCIHNFENQHGTKRRLPCSLPEEEIIAVVSKKPKLWNPTLKDYKSENNLSLWQDVAQELGVSGEGLACKAKWDSIQEQYKNLKRSAENSQRAKKSKYTKKLSFLDPYLSFQQNLKRENCDNNLTAPGLSSSSEKDLNCKLSNDSVTTFFLSIENTVRKLPPDLQIEAKRNIFDVITNCELTALKRNSNQKSS